MERQVSNKRILLGWMMSVFVSFLCLLALVSYFQAQRPRFALIDTQALVSMQAQKMAAVYKNNKAPPEKVQQIANQLKHRAEHFAREHRIVLLARGAVWGGALPDYTEAFMNYLKEDEKSEDSHAP